MTHSNMYTLQRYKGRGTRYTCPNCGRKHCFSYYVNEQGVALNQRVGRCDHQESCGYHYKPKDFFADNRITPPESWSQPMPPVERKLWFIHEDEFRRFRSNESTLMHYLHRLFGESAYAAANKYGLGALIDGSVVYWQIDINGKIRTGKVMAYGEDGHRIKGEQDRINWMHNLLKRDNLLPDEFEMTQCLFGEHLLNIYPDKPVAIVESEKTAVIMSIVEPAFLWLATGGKYNFNAERMTPLKGRKILIYPDADAIDRWKEIVQRLANIYDIRLCDLHYSADDISNKRDIADLLTTKIHIV